MVTFARSIRDDIFRVFWRMSCIHLPGSHNGIQTSEPARNEGRAKAVAPIAPLPVQVKLALLAEKNGHDEIYLKTTI